MTNSTQFLGKTVTVTIDRPLGSKHPDHRYYYPVNYGYVDGIEAPDGEFLDAYVLGIFKPVKTYTGRCVAIIERVDDDEDKLVVVPEGNSYSAEQIVALTEFQERFFNSEIRVPDA